MNRFLALAALFAAAFAGQEYGDGGYGHDGGYGGGSGGGGYSSYGVSNYGSPTAVVSSFVAAPPLSSTTQWANQVWSSTPTPTPVAGAVTSVAPSLITLSLVATPTATGWPKSPAATHTVLVGGSSLTYTPQALCGVKDKDTILFLFFQMNHTLTQSSFALPCNKSDGGFKSGFLPSNGNQIPFVLVEFSDSANTGSPLWFYCGQANHCERGMRFSINAPNQKDTAWRAIDTVGGNATTSAVSSSAPSASIIPGTGTMNNGQCSCDCLCGVGAFPAGDGIGMIGGIPGWIPAASAPSMAGPVSSSPAYSSGSGGWK